MMVKKYGASYYWVENDEPSMQDNYISQTNKRFAEVIQREYEVQVEFEFLLEGKRYDLCVPERKLFLEINPTDTHNAVKNPWTDKGIPRRYHLEKSKLAESHGYRCVHIFQWDDADKVLDMLFSPKRTVYARKCKLMEIDAKTASVFEALYHLQGKCSGQSYCLGLYYQGELIQLMTFGRPRYNRKFQWELLRLCTNSKFRVVGGAERLFHHFLEEKKPESIISYCDRSKFTGEVYTRLGFELYSTSDPNMIWSQGTKRVTNNLLLQRGYDQLFNASYGKGTSNNELMLADGWLPVYDCGQSVYIMRLSRDESK